MKIRLKDNEIIFKEGFANHFKGIEAVGGKLWLTNLRLFFKSHFLNVQPHEESYYLNDLVSVQPVNTLELVPNGIEFTLKDGRTERFVVNQRQDWLTNISSKLAQSQTQQKNSSFEEIPKSNVQIILTQELGSTPKISIVETLSILLLAADPTNASRLRIGEEFREIQEKLQLAKLREKFRIEQRTSVRTIDLSQVLLDLQPQILHFSGHGLESGALCFEDKIGQIHPILPEALAALFEQFKEQVRCILLNACYSEIQAIAISEHIDYVIGMNNAIDDKAAIAFAIGFYQGLGAGRTIESAYKLGCAQVRLQGIPEHLTPVLVRRGEVQT